MMKFCKVCNLNDISQQSSNQQNIFLNSKIPDFLE